MPPPIRLEVLCAESSVSLKNILLTGGDGLPLVAYMKGMKKRVGWKVCPATGGKFAVAPIFDDGTEGNGIVADTFTTPEKAQEYIDSGKAEQFASKVDEMKRKSRR